MKKIATVVCARCGKSKGLYGIRTEKVHNGWEFTWAFRLGESAAKREGYTDTVINSSPETRAGFNGCPYCHSDMLCHLSIPCSKFIKKGKSLGNQDFRH